MKAKPAKPAKLASAEKDALTEEILRAANLSEDAELHWRLEVECKDLGVKLYHIEGSKWKLFANRRVCFDGQRFVKGWSNAMTQRGPAPFVGIG